jgi:SAM-dependent methyltransferase
MDDRYWFDNSLSDEADRLRLLEAIADPRSIRLLRELGIGPGWRCAELGAGGGSMARWLADQVGDTGSVVAVDRDTALLKHLDRRSTIEVVESSIEELNLPSASMDLIHTRNVLMHIDGADEIMADLVDALRPGGALLVEEADYFPLAGMTSPALFDVTSALVGKWTWARTIPNTIATLPVADISVTIDTSMLQGGSPEAAFWTYTLRSVRNRLTDPEQARAHGLPSVTPDTFREAMSCWLTSPFGLHWPQSSVSRAGVIQLGWTRVAHRCGSPADPRPKRRQPGRRRGRAGSACPSSGSSTARAPAPGVARARVRPPSQTVESSA